MRVTLKMFPPRLVLAILLLGLLFLPACHGRSEKDLKRSVVKIFTTIQNVDFYEPWKPGAQVQLEGCGVVIPGNRILTTSHFVNKGNYIEVQKFGETKRYVAKVEQIGYDMDLALLSLEDKEFFKDSLPAEFGDMPSPGDKILIHGGEELSKKEDTLSGLDMVWSTESERYLPGLITYDAIDAKKNGCPVFDDGKFIGLTFDSLHEPEKTGSLIPVNVVQRFLKGIQGGRTYNGFPDIGVLVQTLENPSLQGYYKLPPDKTGVVVTKVVYGGSSDGILQEGDILTAIDGHPIDNEGDLTLAKSQRIDWTYLITFYQMGDQVSLDILRDGKAMKIKVPLKPISKLVSYRPDNTHPTYLLYAGLVFVPLTANYFQAGNWENFKPELKDLFYHGFVTPERKEVVLISHVLPHAINVGYDQQTNLTVDKVNGSPISEMKDLIEAFKHPIGGYQVIEIDDHAWFGTKIVFDAAKAQQATAEIMTQFKIPADRSQDLK
jgi:S1-C subfamily serine protease